MTSTDKLLILAAAAQVLLTLIAFGILGLRRARAFREGLDPQETAADLGRYPVTARVAAANVSNQFETPVLFFAVIATALASGLGTAPLAVLAWIWVATRAIHMGIHLGPNMVRWRGLAFMAGVVVVVAMWGMLAIRALG